MIKIESIIKNLFYTDIIALLVYKMGKILFDTIRSEASYRIEKIQFREEVLEFKGNADLMK